MAQLFNKFRRSHLQRLSDSFYIVRKCHFESDLFEKDNLNGCPKWMKFVINGPHPLKGACLAEIEPRFYIHGIWTHKRVVLPTSASSNRLYQKPKLDQMFDDYEKTILKNWPDLKDPKKIDSALSFFTYEWEKHGLPAGIEAPMYLYYGLALRQAIPDDFGIPIGIPITLSEASESAKRVIENLELFWKPIGVKVPPEINTGYSPVLNMHTIDEIMIEFRRVCDSGRAEMNVVTEGSWKKAYSGEITDKNKLVILPSGHLYLDDNFGFRLTRVIILTCTYSLNTNCWNNVLELEVFDGNVGINSLGLEIVKV